jgi:hypothetical protein
MADFGGNKDRQAFIDTLFMIVGDTGLEPVTSCVLIKIPAHKYLYFIPLEVFTELEYRFLTGYIQ